MFQDGLMNMVYKQNQIYNLRQDSNLSFLPTKQLPSVVVDNHSVEYVRQIKNPECNYDYRSDLECAHSLCFFWFIMPFLSLDSVHGYSRVMLKSY